MKYKEREKLVYQRYPVDEKERTCAMKKREMDEKRNIYRKRLLEMGKEKREYHGWDFSNDASVG